MNVAVVGTGYVGLVSGTCLASRGHSVVCMDTDAAKIARLRGGEIPIHETGLEELVAEQMSAGRLRFTTEYADAMKDAEIVLVAVGTPPSPDGSADLQYVFSAVESVARCCTGFTVLVTKSTVPIGTRERIAEWLKSNGASDIAVASNPEMLREGKAVRDFLEPSRIVIGSDDTRATEKLLRLYASWNCPKLVMSPVSAEMTKYASNAFLAAKISFANEMAILADAVGADVMDVMRGVGMDPRIGNAFLHPGLGWGGSCFPKDVSALQHAALSRGMKLRFAEAAAEANNETLAYAVTSLDRWLDGLRDRAICVLGLSFKGGTDDTRSSPAIALIRELIARGARVTAYDAKAKLFGADVSLAFTRADDLYAAARGADACVIATEWEEFCSMDLARVKKEMRGNIFFDARNIFDPAVVRGAGLVCKNIGRGGV